MLADRIVEHFGVDALDVIENEPKRLIEVPKLGPKRTKLIAAAWEEQKAIKEVMIFLQGVGVSTSLAVRIYKQYQDKAIEVVRSEPYRLASDVWGIGFRTADTIAKAVGIPHDSPQRVKAGLQFTLSEAIDSGDCYLPEEELIGGSVKILQVDAGLVIDCLAELVVEEGVVREELPDEEAGEKIAAIYLVPMHRAEISLANQLLRLLHADADRLAAFADVDWDRALTWLRGRTGAELAPSAGASGKTGVDTESLGVDRRARLRQELRGALDRRTGEGQGRAGGAGRADRAGGQATHRTDRAGRGDRAPAAGTAARRRRRLRPGSAAGRGSGDRRRVLDAGSVAGQQTRQGGRVRARTCCWSVTRTSCLRSAPVRCCVICWSPAARSRTCG